MTAAARDRIVAGRRFDVERVVARATLQCRMACSATGEPELVVRTCRSGILQPITLLTHNGIVASAADERIGSTEPYHRVGQKRIAASRLQQLMLAGAGNQLVLT